MSVLWCGGEDIDFPNGAAILVDTASTDFRTGYARCAMAQVSNGAVSKSTVFPGGAITNCWLSCRIAIGLATTISTKGVGFGLSGTNSGIFIGSDSSIAAKLAVSKYDGATTTQLASEPGTSIGPAFLHTPLRLDVNIINFGASGTINVYLSGSLLISFTGNLAVSGVTNLDSVFTIGGPSGNDSAWLLSEIVVADEDTRGWPGLVTMSGTSNGTTQNWSNPAFTNFNPVTINDSNTTFVNTATQDEQVNITDLPAGTFSIKAVRIAARAMHTSGSTATGVALGVRNGATTSVASAHTVTTAFATIEDLFANDPTTGVAWVQADMNALQLDLRSA